MEDLKAKRDELNSKVKELSEERKRLIEELAKLNAIVKEERQKRDKANEEVKLLKEKRVASFDEIKKIKKELDELMGILERFKDSMGGSYRRLKEELRQLEWEYQTEVHSIRKEKELVKQMDALEKEIAKSELLYDKKKKLTHLQKKLRDLYTEANVYHSLLINRAKESEKHHDTMMKSIREIEKMESSLEKINEEIKKVREEANKYHKEYSKEIAEMPKDENIEALREKANEILANFKAGKKVTMDELALLHKFNLY
jgi:uncharacterized coiled-coil DUF342 family protein